MTEQEWAVCTDSKPMLKFVQDRASDRKLRLLAVTCCLHLWHLVPDKRSRKAVRVSERYADGLAGERELRVTGEAAYQVVCRPPSRWESAERRSLAWEVVRAAVADNSMIRHFILDATSATMVVENMQVPLQVCAVLRDIFGNPFRLVTVDPTWLTSTVVALSSGIYTDRAFDRMPILADALQDAGCDNADILDHCRDSNATHVRGCWVVDLLTGRE